MGAFRAPRRAALPIALALGLISVLWMTLAVQAQAGVIRGRVDSPGGYPLPATTRVHLLDTGDHHVIGHAIPDLNDGHFTVPVPDGLYLVRAVAPGSGYTPSFTRLVSVSGGVVNVGVLSLTTPQIEGQVFAPDGVTLAAAVVVAFDGAGHRVQAAHTPDGNFAMGGLPPGNYHLRAHPASDDPYWNSPREPVTIPPGGAPVTASLTLTDADLWGVTLDENGHPVVGAVVTAMSRSGDHAADHSSASGFWSLGGLDSGDYMLSARAPWRARPLQPPAPISVTVPSSANPYTLTFGLAEKVLVGNVRTNTGDPVAGALVAAERVSHRGRARTLTGPDGNYRLDLGPGLWAVTVRPISGTTPADWLYPEAPQLVYFNHSGQPELKRLNFEVLTADSVVEGEVALPGGGVPGFTVTVALRNSEGIGRRVTVDPADGSFSLRVPHGGYKVLVHPDDPGYTGPALEPVRVPPQSTVDLGTIELLALDATITGTLATPAGDPVGGVTVSAWRPGVPGALHATSEADGRYALAVAAGTWHVRPAPGPEQPYLFTGPGERVEIASGETIPDVAFELVPADATIAGILVDENGDPVADAEGWAAARMVGDPALHNGAPIVNGAFAILVPAGSYTVIANLPPASPYLSTGERQVTVAAGATTTITLTVREKDAAIAGTLVDPRNNFDIVTGVRGRVGAVSQGAWTAAPINPSNGAYRMAVAGGIWHMNYQIAPDAAYAKIGGAINVAVPSGQTVGVPLPVVPKDGRIAGRVIAPDGSALAGAIVRAEGLTGEIQHVTLRTRSGPDGRFEIAVPYGRYRLGAALEGEHGWINPVIPIVGVPEGGVSTGNVLQFRAPDARIEGTLTVSNTQQGGRVRVWAFSVDGGFASGHFTVTPGSGVATGAYALDVISGTTWHVGASFETPNAFWHGEGRVEVDEAVETLDLTLDGPRAKPGAIAVRFDASESQRIELPDGTAIAIPAGAMPVTGTVTLRIVPIASLPHQHRARVVRYGYAFFATGPDGAPIEAHFNQEVLIRFTYDESDLRPHLREWRIRPAYFSTTTNRWEAPESFSHDPTTNEVLMAIDHFTDFALLSDEGSATGTLFVPLAAQ